MKSTGWTASAPAPPTRRARDLVALLGPHPASALGLAVDDPGAGDPELAQWLLAAALADPRLEAPRLAAAWDALRAAGLERAPAGAEAAAFERALRAADHPKPDAAALVLWRLCRGLHERAEGSLSRLAADAFGIEELAGGLLRLAPGFGRAAVVRFLQPLRDVWPAASELPLEPAAVAAAVHAGFASEGDDPEVALGSLRAALRDEADSPPLFDVEAALARLGRRACRRERASRCPLGDGCPLGGAG